MIIVPVAIVKVRWLSLKVSHPESFLHPGLGCLSGVMMLKIDLGG